MNRCGSTIVTLSLALATVEHSAYAKHNIAFIRAYQVHAMGITGRGVTVAVIDDGVDYGPLGPEGSIAPGGASFMGDDEGADDGGYADPNDTHGTQMALVIRDVAPGVRILPIRVSMPEASFYPAMRQAIRHVIKQRQADPTIRVINISVGSDEGYEWECDNVSDITRQLAGPMSDAAEAGIVTFACTGNEANCYGIIAPSCVSCAVPVVATYDAYSPDPAIWGLQDCIDWRPDTFYVMCISNMVSGCGWFLGAPGYHIVAGNFPEDNGTSFATAECSGVAALMFQKSGPCGTLDAYSARDIIVQHAREYIYADPHCEWEPQPRHLDAVNAINWTSAGVCPRSGDLDGDGMISMADFRWFEECMNGPAGAPPIGFCASAQFPPALRDSTGGVDLRDFAAFQRAFTGYGSGACCHPHGDCTIEPVNVCAAEFGATYQGHGTTCEEVQCPPGNWGACCYVVGGTCEEQTRENCTWWGGLYLGDGTRCATSTCPTPRYRNVIDPLTSYIECGPGRKLADDITLAPGGPSGLAYYDLAVYGGGTGFFDVTVGLYTNCPSLGGTLIPGTERTFADNADYGSPVFLSATFDPPVYVPNNFWMVVEFSDPACGWFRADQAEIGSTEDYFARNDGPGDSWVCNYWWHDPNDPNDPNVPYAGYWANSSNAQIAICSVMTTPTLDGKISCSVT